MSQITWGRVAAAAASIVLAWLVIRASEVALNALSRAAPRARFFFMLLAPLVRFGATLLAFLWVIHLFAPTQDAMVALTASLGIAVGFGAQDLVKNIIGGIIILTDRPYQLGDRVQIGSAYGEIDHIGLRSTKLTNPDDTRVTIPNSEVLTGLIFNSNSGVPDCQVVTDLYLPHNADPSLVEEIAYEAAYSSPYLLHSKEVVVLLSDMFSEQPCTRVRIKAYVYDHRYEPRLQSDINKRAKREFLRLGLLNWGE